MKIVHLSDLHLGKRVNEFSMLEDQAYILIRILNVLDDVKPAIRRLPLEAGAAQAPGVHHQRQP